MPHHFVIQLLPAECREIRPGVFFSSGAAVQREAPQPRGEVTSSETKEATLSGQCVSLSPRKLSVHVRGTEKRD